MDKPNWYPRGDLKEPFLPVEIDIATRAFPGAIGYLMPPVEAIPEEFNNANFDRTAKKGPDRWVRLQHEWFFQGLDIRKLKAKPGIDKQVALDHLATIQSSFEPKHEYKASSVAYLASLWFEVPR